MFAKRNIFKRKSIFKKSYETGDIYFWKYGGAHESKLISKIVLVYSNQISELVETDQLGICSRIWNSRFSNRFLSKSRISGPNRSFDLAVRGFLIEIAASQKFSGRNFCQIGNLKIKKSWKFESIMNFSLTKSMLKPVNALAVTISRNCRKNKF